MYGVQLLLNVIRGTESASLLLLPSLLITYCPSPLPPRLLASSSRHYPNVDLISTRKDFATQSRLDLSLTDLGVKREKKIGCLISRNDEEEGHMACGMPEEAIVFEESRPLLRTTAGGLQRSPYQDSAAEQRGRFSPLSRGRRKGWLAIRPSTPRNEVILQVKMPPGWDGWSAGYQVSQCKAQAFATQPEVI